MDQELTAVVVNLMTSDDSKTIIQIVRLFHTLLPSSQIETCFSLANFEALMNSVAFVLQNSLNGKSTACQHCSKDLDATW